jgi:hypothetical protein
MKAETHGRHFFDLMKQSRKFRLSIKKCENANAEIFFHLINLVSKIRNACFCDSRNDSIFERNLNNYILIVGAVSSELSAFARSLREDYSIEALTEPFILISITALRKISTEIIQSVLIWVQLVSNRQHFSSRTWSQVSTQCICHSTCKSSESRARC